MSAKLWGTGSLEAFWWCPAQLAQPFLEIRRTEATMAGSLSLWRGADSVSHHKLVITQKRRSQPSIHTAVYWIITVTVTLWAPFWERTGQIERRAQLSACKDPLYTIEYIEATLFSWRVLIYFSCFLVWQLIRTKGSDTMFSVRSWKEQAVLRTQHFGELNELSVECELNANVYECALCETLCALRVLWMPFEMPFEM